MSNNKEDDQNGHPLFTLHSPQYVSAWTIYYPKNVHNTRATVVIPLMVLDASDIFSLFRFFFHLLNSLLKEYEGALQPQYDSSENDPLFWKSVTLYRLITVLLLSGLDQQLLETHHISLLMRTLSLRQPFSVFHLQSLPSLRSFCRE